ncbi:AzlD domain-containing protein [Lutimaribacter sp. EGI FJ00015]|uniref:AzlD domain-containing protein n=1 Tax=Lutimaribacter degradans TaxID=2945989 RepID=A0ACC5ZTV3_9RHOB|nr:AzlD domain-containing protein [Lutimaribacter sp. EGI FJ00013]MCM2561555.1 AzlD domain-containing protein [Lutimaribacter sp. EGI FJ00013]MCO0612734.1 AzlD domain-containing protein [Lutimaribacter sp. EGI FJ00015]MCO0635392.1 AzlD domain-containing protein [Lutimaribacter sp. EGI FJ00014]
MIDRFELWVVILGLGVGSFALRFVFLGLIGEKPLPDWVLRHLRYTAVAVLPAIVAPLVVWPAATGGAFDPVRATAAVVTLAVGYFSKNVLLAIGLGAGSLLGGLYLFG